MTLRSLLVKVWQGRPFNISEIISLLRLSGVDPGNDLVDILSLVSEKRLSVNRAEEEIEKIKRGSISQKP